MTQNKQIMNEEEMERAVARMSHEILERNKDADRIALVGIRTGGAFLAQRLHQKLKALSGTEIELGLLDITLYRDDLSEIGAQPDIRETEIDFDVNGRRIILIDDVLFTGRTIRCALDAIIDYGRPECIQLAVLIDRGHRELPIKPDFIGKNIPTSRQEQVLVHFKETGETDSVMIAAVHDEKR